MSLLRSWAGAARRFSLEVEQSARKAWRFTGPSERADCPEVRDPSGARIGVVDAVQANPAHDLLVLDSGALVPMVFVVDHEPGVVVVDLPDGLLDL